MSIYQLSGPTVYNLFPAVLGGATNVPLAPVCPFGPKYYFSWIFIKNLHMDAHYITDYGNCKNSAFFTTRGSGSTVFAVLAAFINFYQHVLYYWSI